MTFVGTVRTPDVFPQQTAVEWWLAPSNFALTVNVAGSVASLEASRSARVRWGDGAEQEVAASTSTPHTFLPGTYTVKATDIEGTTRSTRVSVARPA